MPLPHRDELSQYKWRRLIREIHEPWYPFSPQRSWDSLEIANVGWIGQGDKFTTGRTTRSFKNRLASICEETSALFRLEDYYLCPVCGQDQASLAGLDLREGNLELGPLTAAFGQFFVGTKTGKWYVAPNLIHHMVAEHSYRPPDEFVWTLMLGELAERCR